MGRDLARWVALAVVIACVAPFAVYAAPAVVGGDHSFVVLSGSMQPTMAPGDVVVVEETNPATIEEGAIITFARAEEEAPTTHRVADVRRTDGGLAFQTEGDANEDPDAELVPAANVVGTVALTIPWIGHVIQFANTPVGFLGLLIGPLGLLALTEVWSLTGRVRDGTVDRPAGSNDGDGAAESPTAADELDEPSTDAPTDEGERTDATTAENAPAGATGAPTDATDRSAGQITLGPTDLTATTGLLALMAPYAVHVALRLQTALAFSVAFGSAFLLVAAAGVRLTVWRIAMDDGADTIDRGADSATTAPDGGREDAP